ncbi:peptide chain release factor N(5)-glutamine methyltransferase [Ruminococcaceae bacterium OttesenSCG-928-D13]|nr:peptide chain release factor N(5)-glutamine methyltransferase [Ruminococcaceae bacterium OttesenSCG-928-D13]
MNVPEAYRQLKNQLTEAGIEDAGLEADLLLRHVCRKGRFDLDTVTGSQWAELEALAARRTARTPLQYLLGSWAFLDLEILVGPGVLVPRPETEEVCLAAASFIEGRVDAVALDLCAGSGAIALGLQSRAPGAQITAVELDTAAFGWLTRNLAAFAEARSQAPNVPKAVQADALTYFTELADGSLDLIVSNPPYVTENEYAALAPEVHAEPKRALVPQDAPGPDDGLLFYRVIAQNYHAKLKPGGRLVFEIGAGQGGAVRGILEAAGYTGVEIRPDMAGHDRIAMAARPPACSQGRGGV